MTDKEIEDKLVEETRLEDERNRLVMQQVKEICSDRYYQDILKYMDEDGWTSELEIVYEPSGKYCKTEKWEIKGDGFAFDYVFGWQSVGIGGDDYYGEIFVPLLNGKYLKFWFSM
jgi:hypothetical protein